MAKLIVIVHTLSEVGTQTHQHLEGVRNVFSNQFVIFGAS